MQKYYNNKYFDYIYKYSWIELVEKFNTYLNTHREKYNSLFLTNYRESNTIARKRISFGLVYEICNYLLPSILVS
jgi:hypothetical protein